MSNLHHNDRKNEVRNTSCGNHYLLPPASRSSRRSLMPATSAKAFSSTIGVGTSAAALLVAANRAGVVRLWPLAEAAVGGILVGGAIHVVCSILPVEIVVALTIVGVDV